jgi:potassium voltage-gated channel Eag-related subfamily H protein 1
LVVRHYLRTWFLLDFVSAIPFDRFFIQSAGYSSSTALQLPGLIKTIRLLKLRRIMAKWNSHAWGPVLKVVTILCIWLLAAHWVGCIFFVIGWYSCGEYRTTWVAKYWPEMQDQCLAGMPPDPSVVEDADNDVTIASMHMVVMYWAMSTMSSMGYGSAPTAITTLEYAYSILAQMLGACLYAAIFSNIGQMLTKSDALTTRYQTQLDKVREFIRLYKLPGKLQDKIHGYHELMFSVSHGYDIGAIASLFPTGLQEEIFSDMHLEAVRRVPMFQIPECDSGFLHTIVRLLRISVLLEGDFVFKQGEIGLCMYFIKVGYLQVGSEDRAIVYVSKGPGSYLGENTLFNPEMRRNASAWSISDCIFFTLAITDFESEYHKTPQKARM